jgi:pyridoxal/pyridoxine/pyridoxamine kinase
MEKILIKIRLNESNGTELTVKGSGDILVSMFASALYHDKTLREIVTQAAILCAAREMEDDNKSRMN